MRIEITAKGIYGTTGEVLVGTIFEVAEEPKGLEGRYRILSDDKGKDAVTNPLDHDGDGKSGGAKPNEPPSERDLLKARAAELNLDFPGNISTAKLKDLVEAKEAEPKAIEDMSDTELKTYLGSKGVTTTDETRDQLIELAKAA